MPNNEAIVAPALVEYGTVAALIFFFGMIVNYSARTLHKL
ncbi:hypothetical protein [Corynebacterium pyruviciproducens]